MFSFLRPYIFTLDTEAAHDLAIKSLKFNFMPKNFFQVQDEEMLTTELFKKKLRNPIGLAAGFDKSAEVYNSLFKLGFGFVEVGTITPRRQFGNPKPRVFRLEKDNALINRLGFNNDGIETVSERLKKYKPNEFLGINIGPNKDTKDKVLDFLECFRKLNKFASYITVNISSPNTIGLRDFHKEKLLSELLSKLLKIKKNNKITCPIVLKLSPDITGVGGIDSGQSAFEKIIAGATAIQLYTGMVFKGPGIVKDIKKNLIEVLKKEKIKNIQQAIGINS